MSHPLITPKKWLGHNTLPIESCSVAVVGFCRFGAMKQKLLAELLPESRFSHLDLSHQFVGQVGGRQLLALERIYGGPLSATVIEELAYYGIQKVIGYGYAGSLTLNIPVGQIVLADAAFISDGTSREYLSEEGFVYPDNELSQQIEECAARTNLPFRKVKVWTTDALYREYPEKIRGWREAGAEVVNMDTSHFYAVSHIVGISSAYLCVVSDCLDGPVWEDGFARIGQAMSDLQNLIVEVLRKLL